MPQKYYMENEELLTHMPKTTILREDKHLVKFDVPQEGCILKWKFQTEDHDIGFGVLLIVDGKSCPVIPVARVNSHVVAEDGSINCDKLGVYYFYFDNSFSWTRTKTVYYIGEILSVQGDSERSEIKDIRLKQ